MTNAKKKNLGMELEKKIEKQNELYLKSNVASIKKIPNAWSVRRKGPHIIGAHPVPSGLCDFVGASKLLKGRQIVFDAKECALKTAFPLRNIKPSQMDHMRETIEHGGIGFIIIWFTEHDETYFVPYQFIVGYWEDAEMHPNERNKSIPLADIRESCTIIHDMNYIGHIAYVENI